MVPHYKNVDVEYIHHHTPTLYMKDSKGRVIHEEVLQNYDGFKMFDMLENLGLVVVPHNY